MASSGINFFIFAALWVTAVKSVAFINVKCKDKNVGRYSQQSLLECVVQTSEDVQDPNIRVVAWKKRSSWDDEEGQILLGYRGGEVNQKPGYRLAEPFWNETNMNVSLLITNTAVTDEGLYSCMVITNFGDHTSFITLKVQAKYSAPTVRSIPEKSVPSTDSGLICESHGGYPKGELRWFDEQSNDWTRSSETEVKQTPSGLLQLRSTLHLLGGSTFSRYTCVVFSASGGKEDEITFEMPELPPPPPPSGFVNVECKTANVGHPGQRSLLECVVQTSKDVQDSSIRVVTWKKLSSLDDVNVQTVLDFNRGKSNQKPGYRLAEPSWNETNMNVSLLITNTSVTDEGLYNCMVITDSGHNNSFITLKVQEVGGATWLSDNPRMVAFLVGIGLLVVEWLVALLFYRRQLQSHHSPEKTPVPEEAPHSR